MPALCLPHALGGAGFDYRLAMVGVSAGLDLRLVVAFGVGNGFLAVATVGEREGDGCLRHARTVSTPRTRRCRLRLPPRNGHPRHVDQAPVVGEGEVCDALLVDGWPEVLVVPAGEATVPFS
jgi:hypothetical protein